MNRPTPPAPDTRAGSTLLLAVATALLLVAGPAVPGPVPDDPTPDGAAPAASQGLPAASGPHAVGLARFVWSDERRAEMASRILVDPAGAKPEAAPATGPRTVEVHLWYPAEPPEDARPTAPYNPDLDAFAGLMGSPDLVAAQRALATTAIPGAAIAAHEGPLPLVLFSPGGGMFASDYTVLAQNLASNGYLVAVVSHPGVTLMTRGESAVSAEWEGWKPPKDLGRGLDRESLRASSEFFAARDRVLAADLSFVLDQLWTLDADPSSFLHGRIDRGRVAVAGHSTGGAAAAMAAELDRRIGALVVLDVLLPRTLFGAVVRTPFLLLRTDGEGYPPGWNQVMTAPFAALESDGQDVVVHGARHQSFSDRPFQQPEKFGGSASALRVAGIVDLYVRSFLDHYLRGAAARPPVGNDAPEGVEAVLHRPDPLSTAATNQG